MLALALSFVIDFQAPDVLNYMGQDVRARAVKSSAGEWVEELYGKDAAGEWRLILVTPTYSSLQLKVVGNPVTGLSRPGKGLFDRPPTMAFDQASMRPWVEDGKTMGSLLVLRRADSEAAIAKRVWIPRVGRTLRVEQTVEFPRPATPIRYFLSTYAFAPDGKALSHGGKPDSTFVPSIRPKDDQVIGDHQFRAPVISAQKGPLAALMMPDIDVLADNRPIPTIMDLDAANGVVDSTLMSYGFADHKVAGHVYFSHDAGMVRKVPKELRLTYDLIINAKAEPFAAYREAVPFQWEKYGRKNFEKILPQVMPFAEYAEYCYPRVFEEAYGNNKIGWFEVEIDGVVCGGIPSGWGYREGWVSWQAWFNQIRSAWGLRWWGKKQGKADWVDKADKMLNLALAAPMDRGAVPTTYQSREKIWKGSLVIPSPDCYYDLTNMAWKGIWLLRFLEFEDCPRREEIIRQCREMAECMMRVQNADGSFPTWLSKEHKVVPILDRSAQSALPAWFVAEMAALSTETLQAEKYGISIELLANIASPVGELFKLIDERRLELDRIHYPLIWKLATSTAKAADFLTKEIINQQRWYDFETFFSCSPKDCKQRNNVLDDPAMHDHHTLSPPQNTLCMQWTAEFMMVANRVVPDTFVCSLGLDSETIDNIAQDRLNRFTPAALKSLDIMALYQNVWSIPWRPSAYTFGGFGVQNSDGEFLDARQAQFGCTLADFGARLGRREYFERGVAAVRASMTLINHPLHAENGLYPNPNYPPGLQPENVSHGGTDHQAGRTGFDWGEGSGLAAMAWLLHKYGDVYRDERNGWSVGVNGTTIRDDGSFAFKLLNLGSRQSNTRNIERVDSSGRRETLTASVSPVELKDSSPAYGFIGNTDPSARGPIGVTISFWPMTAATANKGVFVLSDGKRINASTSYAIQPAGGFHAYLTSQELQTPFRFEGTIDGWAVSGGPYQLFVDPTFDFNNWRMPGWSVQGNFPEVPTYSNRMNFGLPAGEPFIGTSEDGRGGYDDAYQGAILSPYFIATKSKLKLFVGGGNGGNVYVELLAFEANPPGGENDPGKRIYLARGKQSERMEEMVWDLTPYRGKHLRLRIVDREIGGWGHINVGRFRVVD